MLPLSVAACEKLTTSTLISALVFCRWREVQFLAFKYLDILDHDDQNENVDGMLYDAFFCFRCVASVRQHGI